MITRLTRLAALAAVASTAGLVTFGAVLVLAERLIVAPRTARHARRRPPLDPDPYGFREWARIDAAMRRAEGGVA